ncbi:MAG: hypothetical protein ACJAWL_002204 [Motiliproteus sp.]
MRNGLLHIIWNLSHTLKEDSMRTLIMLVFVIPLLTACGGSNDASTHAITGGGIKGPLVNAIVTVYALDATQSGFKGAVIATGTTDAQAAIADVNLPLPLTPPYIMEFTSSIDTIDLTTGQYPVVATFSTVITQTLIDSGKPIYATPLTQMAVAIAIDNSTSATSTDDFLVNLAAAAHQVVETVGFGMSPTIDIFTTSAVLDNSVDTPQKQSDTLAYRTAIEALVAVAFAMEADGSISGTAETIINELAKDLSDGVIDASINGTVSTLYDSPALTLFTQDPTTLPIPNASNAVTVADVKDILLAETTALGSTVSTPELNDGSITSVVTPARITAANRAVWNSFSWNDGSVWQ